MSLERSKTPESAAPQGPTSCCACEPSEEEMLRSLDVVIDGFEKTDGALIPILQTAQNLFGYLPNPFSNISASVSRSRTVK